MIFVETLDMWFSKKTFLTKTLSLKTFQIKTL